MGWMGPSYVLRQGCSLETVVLCAFFCTKRNQTFLNHSRWRDGWIVTAGTFHDNSLATIVLHVFLTILHKKKPNISQS